MAIPRPPIACLAALIALGCAATPPESTLITDDDAAVGACNGVAPEWNGVVVGAFPTNLGTIRRELPGVSATDRWGGLPDSTWAAMCYIDGFIPKSPPGGEPYDRAMVVVQGGHAELISAGYRKQMQIVAP